MCENLGESARASSLRALRARNSVGKSWERAGTEVGKSWGRAGQELGKSWETSWEKLGEELGKELGKIWGRAGRELGKSWENCENARYIYQKPKIRQVFGPVKSDTPSPPSDSLPYRTASGD